MAHEFSRDSEHNRDFNVEPLYNGHLGDRVAVEVRGGRYGGPNGKAGLDSGLFSMILSNLKFHSIFNY